MSIATLTFLIFLLYLSSSSIGAPLPSDETDEKTASWVSDPNGRGTFSLVESCVLTLSLCVWSAIHLNIPKIKEPMFRQRFRDFRWIVTGILAPELVIFSAWRQWISAKALLEEINGLKNDGPNKFQQTKPEDRKFEVSWCRPIRASTAKFV